ncbi:MAG: hypothetical protein GY771_07955 [bacterium]|nr:hypothetical protein [bacterium]
MKWFKLSEDSAKSFTKWLLWSTIILMGLTLYLFISIGLGESNFDLYYTPLMNGMLILLVFVAVFGILAALLSGLNALDNGIYWARQKANTNYNIWVGVVSAVLFIVALIFFFTAIALAGEY